MCVRIVCASRDKVVRLYMVAEKTASSRSQLEKLCSECVYIPTPHQGDEGTRVRRWLAREWVVLVSRHGARYAYE